MESDKALSCPSASHDQPGAKLFGVVLGDDDNVEVAYLAKGALVDVGPALAAPGIDPGHAFRFAGACGTSGCGQWSNGGCRLGRDIVARLDAVVDVAPACAIRDTCRWFAENGVSACLRCPQVSTRVGRQSTRMYEIGIDVPRAAQASPA